MKKVNSALVRRAPWGIEWAARREEAPRRAQAAAGARVVGSGREMPPVVVGRGVAGRR